MPEHGQGKSFERRGKAWTVAHHELVLVVLQTLDDAAIIVGGLVQRSEPEAAGGPDVLRAHLYGIDRRADERSNARPIPFCCTRAVPSHFAESDADGW